MDELEQKSYNVMKEDLKRLMMQAQEDKKRITDLYYENERLRKTKIGEIDDAIIDSIVRKVLDNLPYSFIAEKVMDCIGTVKLKIKHH